MTFDQAMEAIDQFEGRAICIDEVLVRPAPGARAGLEHCSTPGVLRRQHPSEIDEFWWTLPEAGYFDCPPSGSFVVRKQLFRAAEWDGDRLVIDMGAFVWRIVPYIRSDSLGLITLVRSASEHVGE